MWVTFLIFYVGVDFLKQFIHWVFLKPVSRMHNKWFQSSFTSCSILHPSAGNTQNSREEKKDAQIKSINKELEGGENNRKSATSLILFEEVKFM